MYGPTPTPTNPPHLPQPDYNALRGLGKPRPPPYEPAVLPKSVRAIGSYDPAKLGAVENAFKWPETSRPATNIDANDPRHIWRHAPDGKSCPKPAHPPAVAPLPPPPVPPPEPPVCVIDRSAGTVTWPSTGDVYTGATGPYGAPEGRGCLVYGSGDAHDGYFVKGNRQGPGAYHHGSTGVVTIGNFADDKIVGRAVRYSATRRTAWALIGEAIDEQNSRVAQPDENTNKVGLKWDTEEHGSLSLEAAYNRATLAGCEEFALAVGAPRFNISNETDFKPGHTSHILHGRPITPAQRQSAYMHNALRTTTPIEPYPDDIWPYPLPRGERPFGEEPPSRILVERSVFVKPEDAAAAAACRVANGRPAELVKSLDRSELAERIRVQMEPFKSDEVRGKRKAAAVGGLAGGVGPMAPTPAVPSAV